MFAGSKQPTKNARLVLMGLLLRQEASQPGAAGVNAELLEGMFSILTSREEQILRMRRGIGTEKRSVPEVSKQLGITESMVKLSDYLVLRKLRNATHEFSTDQLMGKSGAYQHQRQGLPAHSDHTAKYYKKDGPFFLELTD